MSCKRIFVSDFDGTLTVADSMFRILRYHRGMAWLVLTMIAISPLLVMMKLHLVSNHRTKEIFLRLAFGNMSMTAYDDLCQRFARDERDNLLRTSLYEELLQAKVDGDVVVVVSASPEDWVRAIVPEFEVIGTQLEFCDQHFTGRFATHNCYGPEKVGRLLMAHPELRTNRKDYHVTAYGDSRGDREMMMFADKAVMIK